jgi:hypothetical protein
MTCSACKHEKPTGPNCEGCKYQCLTCGLHLSGKHEVEGHWMLYQEGHSVFADTKGRMYHQTVEGLHPRPKWTLPETIPAWTCTTCGAALANPEEVKAHFNQYDQGGRHDRFATPSGALYEQRQDAGWYSDGLYPMEPQPAPEVVTVDLRQLALAI